MAMKTFLALYMGSDTPVDPSSLSEETIDKGMAAWGQWMADHAAAVVDHGRPAGQDQEDRRRRRQRHPQPGRRLCDVQAESHEAAAKMFENHPHFAIFPGDSVEIMERLPIPGQG
jgi:hypothetical protein